MFTFASFFTSLLVGIGLQVLGYLMTGKVKTSQSESTQDMEAPTAEQGRAPPVVFGECTIKGLNILTYGDKQTYTYETNA